MKNLILKWLGLDQLGFTKLNGAGGLFDLVENELKIIISFSPLGHRSGSDLSNQTTGHREFPIEKGNPCIYLFYFLKNQD